MRDMTNLPGRVVHPKGGRGDARNGIAVLKRNAGGAGLRVIFSDGMGWDHVSVSVANRCPTWDEMCFVKDLFFDLEDAVIQFHPPRSHYVNVHPNCLHLWRDHQNRIALPPRDFV